MAIDNSTAKENAKERLYELLKLQQEVEHRFGETRYNVFIFGSYLTTRYVEGKSDIDIAIYTEDFDLYKQLSLYLEEYFQSRGIASDIFYIDLTMAAPVYCAPLKSKVQFTDYYPQELVQFEKKCQDLLDKTRKIINKGGFFVEKRNNMEMEITESTLQWYQEYLLDEEKSSATVEKYLRDVRQFLEYLGPGGVVDKEKVREYKLWLKEHYKVSSANSMLAAINSFLTYAGYEELKVKLFKIQKVQYSRPEKELTEKDYEKLVRHAKRSGEEQMSALLQTMGSTGIRISELKFITVESLKEGRTEIYNKGKSRIVLLPVELVRLLRQYCRKAGITSGSIFITKHGNPMDRSNVSKKMKELAREAGVDAGKVFPHNFRHLFARIFYRIEKDVVRLMDLLGHSSITTTRIYTMETEEQPRRQMSRMNLVYG